MPKPVRVPKTIESQVRALDEHLYLLRDHLHRLAEGPVHLKAISAELRVLICKSSGTEGLLWRLMDELQVSDSLDLHVAGNVDQDHPLAQGLAFAIVPLARAGFGDPRLPAARYSYRAIVKEHEAVYVSGQGLTHEALIKKISEQMGSAHEDPGVEPVLVDLAQILVNGVEPFVPVLTLDSEFTIELCERVLDKAKTTLGYQRLPRAYGYGDLTITLRMGLLRPIDKATLVFQFRSFTNRASMTIVATQDHLAFELSKEDRLVTTLQAAYPANWQANTDAVFSFQYSSAAKEARVVVNGDGPDNGIACDLGFLHGGEFVIDDLLDDSGRTYVYRQLLLTHSRLLTNEEIGSLLRGEPPFYGGLFVDPEHNGPPTFR